MLGVPLDFALNLLAKNFKFGMAPIPSSCLGCPGSVCALPPSSPGMPLAAGSSACWSAAAFLYIALFGQWTSAMLTLALISIAVPFCIVTGLFAGIWAWRKPWAERLVVSPALDLMQTIPTFAYLIPMLLLFGNSPVSAMIATAIFATPPMVRATMLGLSRVPSEIDDFSEMAGLHGAAETVAGAAALGAADADGRRQPGDHAGAQHGDHRLDDRRRRPWLRCASGAAGAEGRRGDGGRLAIVALAIALDRLSQAIAHNNAKGPCPSRNQPGVLAALPPI